MKRQFVVSIVALLALILAACGGQDAQPPEPSASEPAVSDAFDTQSSDAGRVVIDVTPLSLSGDVWEFDVALNTHSVNLGFDMTEVSALRCDQGREYASIGWDGSGPGGHHRSGVLKFAALDHPTSFVEIVVRSVAEVPERTFHWEVSGAESGEKETSPSVAAVEAGEPHLALSSQGFFFGDVVMSEGVVSRTIEISNLGPGVLRIEGADPT